MRTLKFFTLCLAALLASCSKPKAGPELDPSIKPEFVTITVKNMSGTNKLEVPIYPFKAVDIGRDTTSFDSRWFVPMSDTFTDTLSIAFHFFNPYQEDTMDVIAVRNEEGRPWVYWEAKHYMAAYHVEGYEVE